MFVLAVEDHLGPEPFLPPLIRQVQYRLLEPAILAFTYHHRIDDDDGVLRELDVVIAQVIAGDLILPFRRKVTRTRGLSQGILGALGAGVNLRKNYCFTVSWHHFHLHSPLIQFCNASTWGRNNRFISSLLNEFLLDFFHAGNQER